MINISIKTDWAIEAIAGRLSDLTPAMKKIGGILRASVMRNFEAGGRPGWKPSMRVLKHGGSTLVKTGMLKNSISAAGGSKGAVIGTKVPYAGVHQSGAKIAGALIPARPYLLIQEEDMGRLISAITDYILGGNL